MSLSRRHLVAAAGASLALPSLGWAQALERPKLTIAVGGKNLLYYLPLTIAEQRGYSRPRGWTSPSLISPAERALYRPWWVAVPTWCPAPSSTR